MFVKVSIYEFPIYIKLGVNIPEKSCFGSYFSFINPDKQ